LEQKRILKVDLSDNFSIFDFNCLMKKIIAPRSIKLGIFRLLEKGFALEFLGENFLSSSLSSLLLNILLNGIENFHNCLRYGYFILYFLRPQDNEKLLLNQVLSFLSKTGLKADLSKAKIFSPLNGFDFLGWHFKFSEKSFRGLYIFPSFQNYQDFLRRIKRIINNSNYGSVIKASKLYPIVRSWKEYHLYSDLTNLSYSLFFVKKKAFKTFNSESKQDFYSSKRLLFKSFSISNSFFKQYKNYEFNSINLLGFGHLTFLFEYVNFSKRKNSYFCVHCGITSF
jgi:hypothetical protein